MTEIKHLSPSGMDAWTSCPDKWWFRYVEHLPEPPATEAMIRGTIVHAAVEALFPVGPVKRPMPSEVNAALSAAHDAEVAEAHSDSLTSDPTEFWESCLASLKSAVDRLSNLDEILYSEVEVRWGDSPIPFYGRCDLVALKDEVTYVIDLKTGKAPERGTRWFEDRLAEKMIQPALYARGLAVDCKLRDPYAYGLLFCPHDAESELFLGQTPASAVKEFWGVTTEIVDALDVGESPGPNPGPLCGWCPFIGSCHAGQAEVAYRWSLNKPVGPAKEVLGL